MVPRRASASSISSSTLATTALQKGTLTSLSSIFLDPFAIASISHRNNAKKLSSTDVSNRTQFINFVKSRCKSENIKLGEALGLFNKMVLMKPLSNVDVFDHLLGAVLRSKHYSTVVTLYRRMNLMGISPGEFTLCILVNNFCHLKQVDLGFDIFGEIVKRGYESDPVPLGTLLKGLCWVGNIDEAAELFTEIVEKGYPIT